jgi:hypothetical protein
MQPFSQHYYNMLICLFFLNFSQLIYDFILVNCTIQRLDRGDSMALWDLRKWINVGLVEIVMLFWEKIILTLFIEAAFHTSLFVLLVVFELCWSIELTAAAFTAKLPLFVVAAHMILQMSLCDEMLIADLALIVSVPIVRF